MDTASILEQYIQDLSNLPAELAHLLAELRDKDMKYYETRKRIQQRDNQIHKFIKQFGSLTKNPKEQQIYNKINEDFEKAFKLQEEKCLLSNTALFIVTKHLTRLESDIETLENEGLLAPLELLEQELSLTSALSSIGSMNISSTARSTGAQHSRQPSSSRKNQHHHQHHHHHHHSQTPHLPSTNSQQQQISSASVSRNSTPSFSTPIAGGVRPTMPPSKRQTSEEFNSESEIVPRRKLAIPPPNLVLLSSMHPKSLEVHMSGPNANGGEEDELYCFCRQVSFGNMIACDNSNCKFEWFHYDCVGLKEPPQGTWYCPDCAKIMLNKKGRKKK